VKELAQKDSNEEA